VERVLELVITGVVWTAVAALLVAIVAVNGFAALHAWRSGRPGWTIVILALFFTGGWIATAVYLVLYHHEPLPAGRRRGRAFA
jgi:hypothetical protein